MSELHSVVCVKVVPKSEEIRVDPHTKLIIREGVRSEINPPDMNALEMALDLRDRYGGRVSILSMGPPYFEPILRVGLAMGADHIYLLSDRALGGADTLDFNTRNDNCTGATLTPSQSCTIQVVFSPRSTGSRSATLSISSNDPDTPTQTVSLMGSGTQGGIIIGSGSTGSFCFFSTSVKGSGSEDYLDILRKFRDTVLVRSHWGRALVSLYYQHSPMLNELLARHEFLRNAVAIGLVPPMAAIAHVTLHTSPAEKAILFLLVAGAMTAGWRLIRKSARAKSFVIRSPACMQVSR